MDDLPADPPPPSLDVIPATPGAVILSPSADLDLAMAPELAARLREIAVEGERDAIVDLTRVAFMDSTGMAVLLNALRRLTRGGHRLLLVCPHGEPRRLLELAGMRGTFGVFDTVQDATAALAAG